MKKRTSILQQERQRGRREIFCPYIVKDGKRIYPRRAKVFRFTVG